VALDRGGRNFEAWLAGRSGMLARERFRRRHTGRLMAGLHAPPVLRVT
jgi:hypothetical protein